MILFLESDVLIDVLQNRAPHATYGANVIDYSVRGRFRLITSPLCIANAHYTFSKAVGQERSKNAIRELLELVELAPMPASVVKDALASSMKDFEDAMQVSTARSAGADVILTRNIRDFKNSPIRVLTPSQFLSTIPKS